MQITFLGTGTSQGVPLVACNCMVCKSPDSKDKRLRSSILVQWDGLDIVVDAGPDFRQQMLSCGIQKLDALIFTHAHKDHIAGLDDVRGFNFKMRKPIDVYCTEQVEQQMKVEFHYIFSEFKYPGIPELTIHRINEHEDFRVNNLPVIPIGVKHYKMPVLGFRFNDFVYITDANYISEESKNKIRGCKIMVLNALRREEHISHFSFQQAIDLINELGVEKAYLTHISHQLGLHESVEQELPEHISLGYDGLTIQV